ncbi:hypothetical protein OSTOST_13339, partial [Ostertagia ostertagi]
TVDTPVLSPKAQSIGNSTALTYIFPDGAGGTSAPQAPQDVAAFYNFPLVGESTATGPIGLIEPGVGSYLGSSPDGVIGADFQSRLDAYLASSQIGQTGTGQVTVQGINGQTSTAGERSLDVGIVAAINPNSDIVLYNGSGQNTPASAGSGTGINGLPTTGYAQASVFTAVQSSIWDPNYAAVTSNSWGDSQSMTPGSPFYIAYWQLFIDAALRNQTTFIALGDGGSGNETSNGVTNVEYNVTQPYNILVGGTSLSSFDTAEADDTLNPGLYSLALAGDLPIIWALVQGGLTTLPTDAASVQYFVETVWNAYYVQGDMITGEPNLAWETGYYQNSTSSGGVDPTQPVPSYQQNYGLNPVTTDPLAQTGRGVPDVAANGGGNLMYTVPPADMGGNDAATMPGSGTSAAAPLWASLGVQLNAVFTDQGLPNLGYMNDLLYIASAIAPASFNDVLYRQQQLFVPEGGRLSDPWRELRLQPRDSHGIRIRSGRGLRSRFGTGHAQRAGAGAYADDDRPYPDLRPCQSRFVCGDRSRHRRQHRVADAAGTEQFHRRRRPGAGGRNRCREHGRQQRVRLDQPSGRASSPGRQLRQRFDAVAGRRDEVRPVPDRRVGGRRPGRYGERHGARCLSGAADQ